jgi:multidrug efflux pump subunit AcrA (membrane-fusion protein)
MHPQIVAHEPGICPICQMQLQRVDDAHGAAAPAARTPRFYRHPMRPDVTSPTPAKNEMGMDYVPVYEEDVVPSAGSDVPGHAPFTLSTERQQLIGVTRGRVERRDLATEIRAAGRVAYDPELYQAIVEYREAVRARAELAKSPWPDARRGADAIVRSAALRLRQRGVSEAQLGAIAPAGGDPLNLLLPGKSVWVYAQVYEYELDLVRPGERVTVTAPSTPHQTYTGTVVAIDPVLDPATRTARVRVLLPTPDANLRPETFVQARIDVPLGRVLAVPEGAVLDTGEHRIVFVVADEGRFEPRSVTLGREAQGYWEVLAGLEEGEEVVTSANFLIDSESRFRAALAAFGKAPAGGHAH